MGAIGCKLWKLTRPDAAEVASYDIRKKQEARSKKEEARRKKQEGRSKKEEVIKSRVSAINNVLIVWRGCQINYVFFSACY
ncbi:hypothetical protein QUB68_29415 [Microcoleus sp. A006_D1]|uniref:hypothetical protein n=1 Tax=Microcoleus sp. A006_D1 TaxID=3055267 RepID=UPI002FD3BB8B